jgi:integrase
MEVVVSTQGWTKTDETGIWTDGSRYRIRTTAKTPDGELKQKQRTLSEGTTLEEAAEVRDSLKEEIRTPTHAPQSADTLQAYCKKWMRRKARRTKPKTAKGYARTLGSKVLSVKIDGRELADISVEHLRREHVLRWVDWAESQTHEDGTPYSTSTVRKWWRVFRQVLKDLHADGHTDRDLSERIPPLQTGRDDVRSEEALSAEQLHDVVDAAHDVAPKRAAELTTLAYTGMRSGEMWALHWDDIDHERSVIVVRRSVSDGQITDRTKAGYDREVPMVEEVSEAIRAHRERLVRSQHPGLGSGLVFPSDVGTPRCSGSLRKALRNICDELGLERRVSPQTFRKTWTTLMALAGVDRLVLREIVGHRDEEMTEHYASIRSNQKHDAVEALAEMGGDSSRN